MDGKEKGSAKERDRVYSKNLVTGPTKIWFGLIKHFKEMLDTKYFRLVNNVDLHARSSKLHIFCYCDIVGRHSDLNYTNAKVGGNDDHTSNTAVAHMKAYKSVKYYLQLTLVNQNEVVISKS